MKINTTDKLRSDFLDFFKSKGHRVISSDSLIPQDDLTVLFTSAGMSQFKKQFLGEVGDFRRAASCQKCLRTGDLDNVGRTSSHHTFFEMLGNFSFGDYFKEEAILWGWEFIHEVLEVPSEKLWVSVYKDDDEAYRIWRDLVKIPEEKIVKFGDKDNFWPANAIADGPNGPCGPCSEIFYDWGKSEGCKKPDCSLACDCGRFVEVWNLVFTQFNRIGPNKLEPLPQKNIDTGMGLERMAAVLQGKKTNFEIDIFEPIIESIKSALGLSQSIIAKKIERQLYAIADHVRAAVFAISDGVMPSNEERGYVIRKLIRRAYFKAMGLGCEKPFMYKIVPIVVKVMKEVYPEMEAHRENISLVIKAEEERFAQTLSEGERIVGDKSKLSPQEAFMLYDTHGYPLELLKEKGIKFDQQAVAKLMQERRIQSKEASSIVADVFGGARSADIDFKTEFVGYETDAIDAKVLDVIADKNETKIILDLTPFYAESGGQIGDRGRIESNAAHAAVYDTKKINDAIIHYVKIAKGNFKEGDKVRAIVDKDVRLDITKNHTATHLLQSALRRVLGEHIRQQGSLVSDEYLRFDFAHFKRMSEQEINRVEELVNEYIYLNNKVIKRELSLSDAKKEGALAFFSEKYQDTVRMVSVGDYSKELCGGLHLDNTEQIGLFKIVSESSIASGVRRIEAITGKFAQKKLQEDEIVISKLADEFGVSRDKLLLKIEAKFKYIKKLEKDLSNHYLKLFERDVPSILEKVKAVKGINLLIADIKVCDMQNMRKALDLLKSKIPCPFITFLFSSFSGNGLFILGLSKDVKGSGYDAKKIIKKLGLKGGGRPDLIQGGMKNKDWEKTEEEWERLLKNPKEIERIIEGMLL